LRDQSIYISRVGFWSLILHFSTFLLILFLSPFSHLSVSTPFLRRKGPVFGSRKEKRKDIGIDRKDIGFWEEFQPSLD